MEMSAQPNIFAPAGGTSTPPPSQPPSPSGRKWITPRNIFIVLGIIVAVELILAIKSVVSRSGQSGTSAPTISQTFFKGPDKGTLSLGADKKEVKVGDTFAVSIELNSPQVTTGVDVVAKFDPGLLSAVDGDIHHGTIFSLYPLAKVEDTGVVRISGIATPGAPGFSGKDIFATVNFKAVKKGEAKITLDFTPGSTADSNIVGATSGKDLLEEVGSLEVVIK